MALADEEELVEAVVELKARVQELATETERLQDNVRAVGDVQRSLVNIAAAWHACLREAAAL